MEKYTPSTSGVIIRPKLLVPDKAIPEKKLIEKVTVIRGTIDPPKKT